MKGKLPDDVRAQLKIAYAGEGLFVWNEPYTENNYVIKPITHNLYKEILERLATKEFSSEFEKKDYLNNFLFEKSVVWPELSPVEYTQLPVGIPPSIAKVVMERSGFINIMITGDVIGPDIHSTKLQDFTTWGDISEDEIEELKTQYKTSLFRVRIDKFIFVIKPVMRSDIQTASIAVDDQLALVQGITVWPKQVDWNLVPTGIVDILGEQANRVSGWNLDHVSVEEL